MMSALPAADRTKLVKLLGLLGSNIPMEREAAALNAHRIVARSGLTWRQIIEAHALEKRLPELGTWRQTVAQSLARPASLRPWEKEFLRDLTGFRRLSVKQRYVLKEIADRILERTAA